jgi:hypothetical protein
MKNEPFTTQQYIAAIDRELGKRATTYPKILKKMEKQGCEKDDIQVRAHEMTFSNECLLCVKYLIEGYGDYDAWQIKEALTELTREYKMRLSYYPRLVWLDRNRDRKRLDQATADYEIAIWKSLCFWFARTYLDLDVLPPLTKRGKPIAP